MDKENLTKEECILLARLSQQTERYHQMVDYVGKMSKISSQLTVEERSILSAAYKNVVGNQRAELRVLTAIKQKELSQKPVNENNINYINNYELRIKKELKGSCDEILDLIENTLIPKDQNPDADYKTFFLQMKGDYYRYLSEFMVEDQFAQAKNEALQSYSQAEKLANNFLAPTHPIRLGLYLNFSVFYYEIMENTVAAHDMAKAAFQGALATIDSVNEENYKDCTLIMQLLRDNITLWSNENQDENQVQVE